MPVGSDLDASGGLSALDVDINDIVYYKTGSGSYGYLVISGMYLDLTDSANSCIDVYYTTEVQP